MTATDVNGKLDAAQQPYRMRHMFILAAWFGLLAGLVEGTGLLICQRYNWFSGLMASVPVDVPILWVSSAFDFCMFVMLGLLLSILYLLPVRLPRTSIAVFLFADLMFLDWCLVSGRIRLYASVILALGLAVTLTRWYRNHERRALRFFWKTLPVLLGTAILMFSLIEGGKLLRERRALAALPSAAGGAPNVLILIVDTLRADHLSAYGYSRPTSPHFDRIVSSGVLFENTFATSSWTLPSHVSLLTGRYPFEHGAVAVNYDGRFPTLAAAMRDLGYRTAAFSANIFFFARARGFGPGFIRFEDSFVSLADMAMRTLYGRKFVLYALPHLGDDDMPARRKALDINDSFLRWVDRTKGHPFFVCLNYLDTHDPYLPPAPYRTKFSKLPNPGGIVNDYHGHRESNMTPEQLQGEIDAYDGSIAYVDDNIQRLFSELERRGLDKNTLIVITSDHGEAFMEHGIVQHKNALYRELIQVPLVFWWPGHLPAGTRVEQAVTNAELPATVMELVGAKERSTFPGRSLAALWQSPGLREDWPYPLAEIEQMPWGLMKKSPVYSGWMKTLVSRDWQYVLHEKNGASLYRWREDRLKSQDLASSPEGKRITEEFANRLRQRLAGSEESRRLQESTNRH